MTDAQQTPEQPKSLLSKIKKGKAKRPRRCMLYGVPGIGKSTWGANWPSPIFVPTEDGCDDIDVDKFPLVKTINQFIEAMMSLFTDQHDYKTVVIDSADWLERIIRKEVCKEANVESIADIDYGKGYERVAAVWDKKVLPACNSLRDKRGMHVLMLAHCKVDKFKAPDADQYQFYQPRLHESLNDLIIEWCDELLFARYETMTITKDEGFGNKRTRAVGEGARYVECNNRPSAKAKNRLKMPNRIPLTFESYQRYWSGDRVEPEISDEEPSEESKDKQPAPF